MITYLEPDILEYQVKWALRSITTNRASGGDGIPVELFQILKDDAVKVMHSVCQQIWKLSSGHRTGKVSFHSNPKERQYQRMFKPPQHFTHSHVSKVTHKILQARLQQYMNLELPDVQAGFRKDRGTRDQIANIRWITEKTREFQKTSISAFWTMPKPLTVCHNKLWKILLEMGIPDHQTCLLCAGQEATVRTDMGQETGSK